MNDSRHVLVAGGGVIGVACAHYLQAAGFRVTVIDQGAIGKACSHGNCGLIVPSHVLPLAEPGAVSSAFKALLRPGGAFRIRPRLDPTLWSWLWRFARRCNRRDMLQSGRAIQPLLASSRQLYDDLMESERLECEWQTEGLLFVYRTAKLLDAYEPVNELMTREFNEPARRIDGPQLQQFEPALRDGLAGAWYFEHDAQVRPDRLLASWRTRLESQGVQFRENCQLLDWSESEPGGNGVVDAALTSGESITADGFVVAAGAWTPQLARILRCRIPIQPGKGYSITLPRPDGCPRVPLMFPEHRVVATPFQSGLRLGSIMEFAGYDSRVPPQRLRLLTAAAAHYLREPIAHDAAASSSPWYGWRPMTYDSTPVIGRCPALRNVYVATGHNMLGLSMAPATGRLISELVAGAKPHLPPEPYCPTRFG